MCGIVGGANLNSYHSEEKISFLADTLHHRGPDEFGFVSDSSHFLASRRLSIIDVANGHQPVFNEKKDIEVVFNGQIYNYKKLRSELGRKGHKFESDSDTEIIPHLYEEYGEEFITKIEGMFSIALYDKRVNCLLLYRDRLGKKPLLYQLNELGEIYFASEMKTLIALQQFSPIDVSEDSIVMYLTLGYVPNPNSIFKKVKKVKPATYLKFHKGVLTETKYWNLDININNKSLSENMSTLDQLLKESVSKRLVSEKKIGAFLSGGIDSSLVVAYMADLLKKDFETFSISFDDQRFDESIYAKQVATKLGVNHKIFKVSGELALDKIDQINDFYDEPFADSSSIPTFILSEFASNDVTVVLSGDGGDEGFGGYSRYQAFDVAKNFFHAIQLFQKFSQLFKLSNRVLPRRMKRLLTLDEIYSEPGQIYETLMTLIPKKVIKDLMLNKDSGLYENSQKWFQNTFNTNNSNYKSIQPSIYDINSYLPDDLLYKVDISSMANSIEVRSPFLDTDILEFGLSLSKSQRYRFQSKVLLRKLAESKITKEIASRPKMGFGIPRDFWLRGPLKSRVEDVFKSNDSVILNWFERSQLISIHNSFLNHQNDIDHGIIWNIFSLETWARRWLT
jgi:asparagine synthase (glutamine-hydrolysing)